MIKTVCSLTAALLLGFVGGIIGTLTILHREKASIQREVRARRFEIVDENGEMLSVWGVDHLHNPLLAFAPSGAGKEGRPFEGYLGHKLSLDDVDSQRVGIGLTADGDPFFKFRGHDEKPRASLYVDSDGKPDFTLWDEKTWRVVLGIQKSDTPGPQDNDWGLDFNPERAGIGMACVKRGAQTMVHGYSYLHKDETPYQEQTVEKSLLHSSWRCAGHLSVIAWFRQLTLTSGLLVIRPSKRYSRTVSQAPRRARASELQKGFVARLDDAL